MNCSEDNRFVTGSKNGIVTVCNDSTPRSRKVFNNSDQRYNATRVRYANNKIFAVGLYKAKLHILNLELKTLKIVDHDFNDETYVLVASDNYVAIGDYSGNVTVFDHNGNLLLVSYF